MAHLAKYPKCSCGHMLNHYGRTAGDGVPRKNENIKAELTHKNYNLAEKLQPLNQYAFVKKRLSEIKVQKRADVNVICDWVLTAPQDLKEQDSRKFFEAAFEFMTNRYGKENVVSAYVHLDETTPHMHFAFVPVVMDKRKKIPKLSAKEATPRADLKTFHSDLSKHIEDVLGYEVSILNEATREGNKAIEDLRRETSRSAIAEQKEILEIEKAKTAPIEARNLLLAESRQRHGLEVEVDRKKKYFLAGEEQVTLSLADFKEMEKWVNIGLNAMDYVNRAERLFSEWRKKADGLLTQKEHNDLLDKLQELEKVQKQMERTIAEQNALNKTLQNELSEARSYKWKAEERDAFEQTALRLKGEVEAYKNWNAALSEKTEGQAEVLNFYDAVRKNDAQNFDALCDKYCDRKKETVTLTHNGNKRTYGQRVRTRSRDDYSR